MILSLLALLAVDAASITQPDLRNPQPVGAYNEPIDRDDIVPYAKAEFQTFRQVVMADPNLSAEEKAQEVAGKLKELRDRYVTQRKQEWDQYFYMERAQNGVGKGRNDMSGDTNKSYGTCHYAPDHELQTSWEGTSYYRISGTDVNWGDMDSLTYGSWYPANPSTNPPDRHVICSPNMRRSGAGKEMVRVFAVFRYPGAVTDRKAAEDAGYIIEKIQ